jgi:thioredoxin-related protein
MNSELRTSTPKVVVKKSAQNMLKKYQFLLIFAQNPFIFCKKMQRTIAGIKQIRLNLRLVISFGRLRVQHAGYRRIAERAQAAGSQSLRDEKSNDRTALLGQNSFVPSSLCGY